MGDPKPVIAVAALIVALVGEGWLRSKVHQFDEDYVSVGDLIGRGVQTWGRGHTWTLRPLPKSPTRSYRRPSPWLLESDVPSKEGQPGR